MPRFDPYRIDLLNWHEDEFEALADIMAEHLANLAGVVVMLGIAPLAVVMVLAGIGG